MEFPKGADMKPPRDYCIPLEVPSLVSIYIGVAARGIFLAKGKLIGLPVSIFREVRRGEDGENFLDTEGGGDYQY